MASVWRHFVESRGLVGGHETDEMEERHQGRAFIIESSTCVMAKRGKCSPLLGSVRGLVERGCGMWWDGNGRRNA